MSERVNGHISNKYTKVNEAQKDSLRVGQLGIVVETVYCFCLENALKKSLWWQLNNSNTVQTQWLSILNTFGIELKKCIHFKASEIPT